MKKLLVVTLTLLMLLSCIGLTAFAQSEPLSANVYVSISNKGSLVIAQEKLTVTDIDGDNALTVNDALYLAHEAKYEGGAAAGYNYYIHDMYGLSLGKLWGDESGNFGYRINNASSMGLADPVNEGDYLKAFIYADEYFGDIFTWFDVNTVATDLGQNIELTLSGESYDAFWNPVIGPVAGATITVNGKATEVKTDTEGKVTIQINEGGSHTISATSDTQIIVPPVCIATVSAAIQNPSSNTSSDERSVISSESEQSSVSSTAVQLSSNEMVSGNTESSIPKTSENSNIGLYIAIILISFGSIVLFTATKKRYEN